MFAQTFKVQDEDLAKEECDPGGAPPPALVPTYREDEPNLALLVDATAEASSTIQGWCPQRHCLAYLNDGFYNNCRSWIGATSPSWAQIDIGQVATVSRVFFGSEHEAFFRDRAAATFQILVADTVADPDSAAATWTQVIEYDDPANLIHDTTEFKFDEVRARWVRIAITREGGGGARIDEIEIYGGTKPLAVQALDKSAVTWGRIKAAH